MKKNIDEMERTLADPKSEAYRIKDIGADLSEKGRKEVESSVKMWTDYSNRKWSSKKDESYYKQTVFENINGEDGPFRTNPEFNNIAFRIAARDKDFMFVECGMKLEDISNNDKMKFVPIREIVGISKEFVAMKGEKYFSSVPVIFSIRRDTIYKPEPVAFYLLQKVLHSKLERDTILEELDVCIFVFNLYVFVSYRMNKKI